MMMKLRLTTRDEDGNAILCSSATRIVYFLEKLCRYEEFEKKINCTLEQLEMTLFSDHEFIYTIWLEDEEPTVVELETFGANWRKDQDSGQYEIWLNCFCYDKKISFEVPARLLGYEYFTSKAAAEDALEEGRRRKDG